MNRPVIRLCALLLSAAPFALGSTTSQAAFADAEYISPSALLAELREVSVVVSESEELADFVSEEDLESDVVDALNRRNITVRPGSAFRVQVTALDRITTFSSEDDESNTQDIHDVVVQLDVLTRGVVRRGDKLYAIMAAPIEVSSLDTVIGNNRDRRLFFGDETKADLEELLPSAIDKLLERTADDGIEVQNTWYAELWNDEQKAAAAAELAALQRQPIDRKGQFAGIDTMPHIVAGTPSKVNGCRLPAEPYANAWRGAYTEKGWTRTVTPAPLELSYDLVCTDVDQYNTPKYTRIWHSADLKEANFVFELNGRFVRKWSVIAWWHKQFVLDHDDDVADVIEDLFSSVRSNVGLPPR